MTPQKPKRRTPPKGVQRSILVRQDHKCQCGCGEPVGELGGFIKTEYQHTPALSLREIAPDGSDWIPPQHDIQWLFAMVPAHHRRETYHPRGPHTSLGSDRHAKDKIDRLTGVTGANKPSRAIPSRPFQAGKTKWPKGRKLQGDGLQQTHRPMRGKKP